MSKMSDLLIEISELIEHGYSDEAISNRLNIELQWIKEVRQEYVEDV